MGVGGGKQSSNSSQSASGSNTSYGSAMNLGQETQYQNLWAQAGAMNASGANQGMGTQAWNQAQGYMGQQASALNSPYMQGAQNTLGRLQNPGIDPMMGVYGRQIGQQFNEQVMPGLRGDAMVAGGLGNSRAGIAQGLAGARMGQQLQDFGAQLYGQNQDRALNAANAQGALQGAISQAYGGMGQQAMDLGQFGMGIPWYNLQQFAGLLGGPVMEDIGGTGSTSSSGGSSGKASNFNAHIW